MCVFRKILGCHLTDLGVVASRLRGFVPHPPIPLLYRPPRKASLSRPLFWPKSSSRRLNQKQDPSEGQILIKSAHPRPSTRTGVSNRFHETRVERPMRVWRWVVLRCSLEGGMHMHMVLACPTLTPPSHRNPGSAKSAEFSVGVCHQQCSKSRWPW